MAQSPLPRFTCYLIIGGGPAGLALHAALLNNGVPSSSVLQVEKHPDFRPREMSRALIMHARTLEVLEEGVDAPETRPTSSEPRFRKSTEPIDPSMPMPEAVHSITELLIERGEQLQRVSIRRLGRESPMVAQQFENLETRYPFFNTFSQTVAEEALLRRVETLGGRLHRGWTHEGFERRENGIYAVNLKGRSGEAVEVQADYVIGADGGGSLTRKTVGMTFDGGVYPTAFVLADVEMSDSAWPWNDGELGIQARELSVFLVNTGAIILIPLPGKLRRIVATVPQAADSSPEAKRATENGHTEDRIPPTQAEMQVLLDDNIFTGHADADRPRIVDMGWASRFHIHHRITSSFRSGRVMLVGDAAHVHSPAGGQGMNTGIQDGVTLGLVLARLHAQRGTTDVGGSEAEEAELEAWAAKRLEVAHAVVDKTDKLTKLISVTNPTAAWLRNRALELAGWIPAVTAMMAHNTSGLGYR